MKFVVTDYVVDPIIHANLVFIPSNGGVSP